MRGADYNNQMYKQIQELIGTCNDLKKDIKEIKLEHAEEIRILKKEHAIEIKGLKDRINVLEKGNKDLKDENQKLRKDNDRMKKIINNNSDNSSNPPSSDNKPNKKIPNNREKSGKKAGGQKGHKPYILAKKYVEEKIQTGEFEHQIVKHGNENQNYKSKYILDIKISAIAEEHRFYADENGKYNVPYEFVTDVQYGANLKTLCTSLNTEGYVALDRLAKFVENLTNGKLKPSKGSIVNFIQEFNNKSKNIIANIKENILNSTLLHTDATVSRCNSINQSVRNYSTESLTLLVGSRGKSKKYLEETNILPRYIGNLIHDHETVIYNYGDKHGECNVHILRYLKGCIESTKHKWAKDLSSFLCCLNSSKKKLEAEGCSNFEQSQLERFSRRYDEILENGFNENKTLKSKYYKDEEKKLLNRLKKYKENHLLFVYDFSIPFDNNLSERDLRHVKSKLKISGCFRSETGMQNYLSIVSTCRKKALNFYQLSNHVFKNIPDSLL